MNVSGLIVTTYFGGSAEKSASPQDQHVFFDNFIISTRPISHQVVITLEHAIVQVYPELT